MYRSSTSFGGAVCQMNMYSPECMQCTMYKITICNSLHLYMDYNLNTTYILIFFVHKPSNNNAHTVVDSQLLMLVNLVLNYNCDMYIP